MLTPLDVYSMKLARWRGVEGYEYQATRLEVHLIPLRSSCSSNDGANTALILDPWASMNLGSRSSRCRNASCY